MLDQYRNAILVVIPDAEVYVSDPNQDGQHFQALVISSQFIGMPLIKQHQMVLNALKKNFSTNLHAMSVKTFTPDQWTAFNQ